MKWKIEKRDDDTYALLTYLGPVRIFDHYPAEEEIEAAIAMSKVMA